MTALRASGIRVLRGAKLILRDVDLSVAAGEVVGLLGPSGAGKSTLFRVLAGETRPDAGAVHLGDDDVTGWALWRRARAGLGYVPQSPSVLWDLTVRDNLETYARVAGVPEGDLAATAARVDLAARLDVPAGELSAGERRRLELARAVTRKPRFLICDEPFSGVDPAGAERLGQLLVQLAADGVGVVLADHHVTEALRVCTRAVLLLDGRIAVEAPPQTFQEDALVQGRYLGTWRRTIPPPP